MIDLLLWCWLLNFVAAVVGTVYDGYKYGYDRGMSITGTHGPIVFIVSLILPLYCFYVVFNYLVIEEALDL